MPFRSILFDGTETGADIDAREAPECFKDLNLDQIVASITAGRDEYDLKPFFHAPLSRVETIRYRHDILRDIEDQALSGLIAGFAKKMRAMRSHLAQAGKLHYERQKQGWFLDAVDAYCDAVGCLARDLAHADLRSRGFLALREYLTAYTESGDFASLLAETQKLKADLSGVVYCLHIEGNRLVVGRYDSEPDYSAEVLRTFEKFKQGAVKEYRFDLSSGPDMNHVEAAVLNMVAQLYPEIFSSLEQYCRRRSNYLDGAIRVFDREVQFYAACLEHAERIKRAGLPFCYPTVTGQSKEVYGREVFDLALADKLTREKASVVTNDFHLKDPERICLVSGPNQGGKTTFARTFGQLHYLARLGCPVPAREARLFLCDSLFTHFEREEDLRDLSSKLENDLLRIHDILQRAAPDSIIIMNESCSSTTMTDALFLGKELIQRIIQRDMLCVFVTFLDELASLSDTIVSMVSTVYPDDPARRTFKIVRRPANGLAYAAAIAEKHRLTYECVKERIAS
ncbi:MAG: DNA mismatch repair protein MutS [Elusimicrobia bacterium]|nr:DNA mismatch repair protein MutS [Elusimicrobiota bacterium]